MDMIALQKLLSAMSEARVMVVGDLMLDRFIYGEVSRVSAEAPVPILARSRESVMLGAAGNVARNVAALGGSPTLIGAIGDDNTGEEVTALLAGDADRMTASVTCDPGRPTTTKVRFVSAGQQLLRVDHEATTAIAGHVEQAVIGMIGSASDGGAQAILLSDYGKGVVTQAVIDACLAAARASGAPLIVDSKARGFGRYGAADIVKPNAAELAFATDLPTDTDAEIEAALARGS